MSLELSLALLARLDIGGQDLDLHTQGVRDPLDGACGLVHEDRLLLQRRRIHRTAASRVLQVL